MLTATKKILNKYDDDTQKMDISNKNIKGLLDLGEFKKIKILDCSNNKITQIINIPLKLEYLDCSKMK